MYCILQIFNDIINHLLNKVRKTDYTEFDKVRVFYR